LRAVTYSIDAQTAPLSSEYSTTIMPEMFSEYHMIVVSVPA
jgi:hypothetical protein